jgi:tellurite methyltransferase
MMTYDLEYSKKEFYWGLKTNSVVINSQEYLCSNAKVLDLGCGEGKNSFFLANNGFDVTAVDISSVGIDKLKKFAKQKNLNIKSKKADINNYLFSCEKFDAIFAIHVLQFINKKNILKVIKQIQSKTNIKGLNVIASFIAKNSKNKKKVILKNGYLFDKKELKKLYKDWKILFYEEKLGSWETHCRPKHRHFKVKLIAQKLF